jgi:hypothetical protein
LNTTPPRPVGEVKKSFVVFDDFDKLLALLREFVYGVQPGSPLTCCSASGQRLPRI